MLSGNLAAGDLALDRPSRQLRAGGKHGDRKKVLHAGEKQTPPV
jgi:hypothetical protein